MLPLFLLRAWLMRDMRDFQDFLSDRQTATSRLHSIADIHCTSHIQHWATGYRLPVWAGLLILSNVPNTVAVWFRVLEPLRLFIVPLPYTAGRMTPLNVLGRVPAGREEYYTAHQPFAVSLSPKRQEYYVRTHNDSRPELPFWDFPGFTWGLINMCVLASIWSWFDRYTPEPDLDHTKHLLISYSNSPH